MTENRHAEEIRTILSGIGNSTGAVMVNTYSGRSDHRSIGVKGNVTPERSVKPKYLLSYASRLRNAFRTKYLENSDFAVEATISPLSALA